MNLRHLLFTSLLSFSALFAQEVKTPTLDEKIAGLVVLGFHGTAVTS